MVFTPRFKKTLKLYPHWLDKSPNSNFTKHLKVVHEQWMDIRQSIKKLELFSDIERPLQIQKVQKEKYKYDLTFNVVLPHIKKVKIYRNAIRDKDGKIIFLDDDENSKIINEIYFENENVNFYTFTYTEESLTQKEIIPKTPFILEVFTHDEYHFLKGYPENPSDEYFINIWSNTIKNKKIIFFHVDIGQFDSIEKIKINKIERDGTVSTILKPSDTHNDKLDEHNYLRIRKSKFFKYEYELDPEDEYTDITSDYTEYLVDFQIEIVTTNGNVYTRNFLNNNSTDPNSIFDHDSALDVIGKDYNIPRRHHIKTDDLENTYPTYFDRNTEDDYYYMRRIQEYIRCFAYTSIFYAYTDDVPKWGDGNEGHILFPSLEFWKYYGLDSKIVNRKWLIAQQNVSYLKQVDRNTIFNSYNLLSKKFTKIEDICNYNAYDIPLTEADISDNPRIREVYVTPSNKLNPYEEHYKSDYGHNDDNYYDEDGNVIENPSSVWDLVTKEFVISPDESYIYLDNKGKEHHIGDGGNSDGYYVDLNYHKFSNGSWDIVTPQLEGWVAKTHKQYEYKDPVYEYPYNVSVTDKNNLKYVTEVDYTYTNDDVRIMIEYYSNGSFQSRVFSDWARSGKIVYKDEQGHSYSSEYEYDVFDDVDIENTTQTEYLRYIEYEEIDDTNNEYIHKYHKGYYDVNDERITNISSLKKAVFIGKYKEDVFYKTYVQIIDEEPFYYDYIYEELTKTNETTYIYGYFNQEGKLLSEEEFNLLPIGETLIKKGYYEDNSLIDDIEFNHNYVPLIIAEEDYPIFDEENLESEEKHHYQIATSNDNQNIERNILIDDEFVYYYHNGYYSHDLPSLPNENDLNNNLKNPKDENWFKIKRSNVTRVYTKGEEFTLSFTHTPPKDCEYFKIKLVSNYINIEPKPPSYYEEDIEEKFSKHHSFSFKNITCYYKYTEDSNTEPKYMRTNNNYNSCVYDFIVDYLNVPSNIRKPNEQELQVFLTRNISLARKLIFNIDSDDFKLTQNIGINGGYNYYIKDTSDNHKNSLLLSSFRGIPYYKGVFTELSSSTGEIKISEDTSSNEIRTTFFIVDTGEYDSETESYDKNYVLYSVNIDKNDNKLTVPADEESMKTLKDEGIIILEESLNELEFKYNEEDINES